MMAKLSNNTKVEILVGMVASGKSTYSRSRADEGAIIINDDSIVTSVHGGNYSLYDPKLKSLYKSISSNIIYNAVSIGKDVIIDSTNILRDSRMRFISIAKSLDVRSVIVKFPFSDPLTHAKRRFESDHRGYTLEHWLSVVNKHFNNYEEIDGNIEKFDDIIYVENRCA